MIFSPSGHSSVAVELKVAWLLRTGKTACKNSFYFHPKSRGTCLSTANDSETKKSVCQIMLASFAKALAHCMTQTLSMAYKYNLIGVYFITKLLRIAEQVLVNSFILDIRTEL